MICFQKLLVSYTFYWNNPNINLWAIQKQMTHELAHFIGSIFPHIANSQRGEQGVQEKERHRTYFLPILYLTLFSYLFELIIICNVLDIYLHQVGHFTSKQPSLNHKLPTQISKKKSKQPNKNDTAAQCCTKLNSPFALQFEERDNFNRKNNMSGQ